jgi:hypothetical protein
MKNRQEVGTLPRNEQELLIFGFLGCAMFGFQTVATTTLAARPAVLDKTLTPFCWVYV